MPMQPQFGTTALTSFHLFFDNWITQRGQAYTNITTPLFYQPDPKLPGWVAYASPFRSWVCDSGISGAQICQCVSGSLGLGGTGALYRGDSGMMIDYENGRVLFPETVGTNATLSGTYAFKDVNVYQSNQTQENVIFTDKYYLNSRFARPITGIPPAYDMVTPAVFVNKVGGENKPWAFGGTYNTETDIGLVVLAENLGQLEGVLSLAEEMRDCSFPKISMTEWPLTRFGDFKNGSGYNYETYKEQYGTSLISVTNVKTAKVSDTTRADQSLFIGLIDVEFGHARNIH